MAITKGEESASTANTILWVSTVGGASLVTTDRLGYQRHHQMLVNVCISYYERVNKSLRKL